MGSIQVIIKNEEKSFGVQIIDIRIGRTDLTEQVSNNVYQRMRSERDKEANLLRAEGEERSKEIRASADRQQTVIVAEACLLYTSPSPRDLSTSRMPSSA